MDDAASHLDTVTDVFGRLGIAVRNEHLGGTGGGLCMIRGKQLLFVDVDADLATQLDRSLAALSTVPDVDSVYLVPSIRERIERFRRSNRTSGGL